MQSSLDTSGIFATVMFAPTQIHTMKKLSKQFVMMTRQPVHISFEQRGAKITEIGKQPHMHIALITQKPQRETRLIRDMFATVSGGDIVVVAKTPFLMADILFRYLKGLKKEYAESPGMRDMTQRFITRHDLQPITARGIMTLARRGITSKDYQAVVERGKRYALEQPARS